ncbi:arginyl-tRNA--protein transferase 1-like isoform X2 [Mercenaria mercenaria]|uniref:arginyl-tRNA--protein transferase 1-like isoform X2 n=1 Tax=Mercenaria mercenaria TaxID=6596 RepID=UPI00234E4F79|nr:arginyl-tRNA--protein transferase 1-like isoform X2 [Mercenaria mercenaria]
MAGQARTIVEYFAEHEAYRCGYCGNSDTNYSHGMWAHTMTVQDYQDLLNRGWRRSGKYCYKPTMNVTCCPMYTIRCEALKFKLRKSHKKVLKKVNKYLIEGIQPSGDIADDDIEAVKNQSSKNPGKSENKSTEMPSCQSEGGQSTEEKVNQGSSKDVKTPKKGAGPDPNKPPCKKAKDRRKEKKMAKLAAKGESAETSKQNEEGAESKRDGKTLEEFLAEPSKATKCAHKLEIKLVRSYPKSDGFKTSYEESYKVYKKYQMTIHKDTEDDCSKSSYNGFLVDSPLESSHPGGSLPEGYGSFHQQYILDGKIICVGVIDILPSLISSKYLYYDPDYQFLSLGTYSALVELALVRDLHKHSAELIYYYMGYYIHSCPKMIYKGQYHPSYLLCPETYTWHPVEKCGPMLDQKTYCRFEEDPTKDDENGKPDLENLLVLFQRTAMPYPIYKALSKGKTDDLDEVTEYAGFVGKKCASSILLFRK